MTILSTVPDAHAATPSGTIALNPCISVVVPVLNNHATLRRCIQSVLTQEYGNCELIVMDGGSTDGSLDILHEYASKLAYWESSPDRGIYHAFNKGVEKATGE